MDKGLSCQHSALCHIIHILSLLYNQSDDSNVKFQPSPKYRQKPSKTHVLLGNSLTLEHCEVQLLL